LLASSTKASKDGINRFAYGVVTPEGKAAFKADCADAAEVMLEDAARDFVNHPCSFALANNRLTASSIYQWH
jgi:hypothetical protein